jgi:hypothetical protein
MEFARVDAEANVVEFVDIEPQVHAEWTASGNPKASAYLPVATDPMPPYNPATSTVEPAYVVTPSVRVVRRWTVRPLTADELRRTWTPLEFLSRFTDAELAAVEIARANDSNVQAFYRSALAAQEIVSDDARTVGGMALLVSVGIVTQARSDAILSG